MALGTRQRQTEDRSQLHDLHGTQVEVDAVPIVDATDDDDAKIAAGATDDDDAQIAAGATDDEKALLTASATVEEDATREVAAQQPELASLATLAASAIPDDDA